MKFVTRNVVRAAALAAAIEIALASNAVLATDARAEAPPVALDVFGTCGTGPGQFQSLWGITASPDGSFYVADEQAQRITKFDGATGDYVAQWDVPNAFDVAAAPDGSVYVLRRTAGRIEHYSSSGSLLAAFGSLGSGDGQFSNPHGISIDPQGQLFVADTGNHRIQRLAADGTFLGKWGRAGGFIGDLGFASEVAADAFGNVFVADSQNGRIYRFSTTGTVLGFWYLGGPLSIPLAINYGLAVDPAGNVFVAEADRFVDKYTPNGTWLTRFGGEGSAPGQFGLVFTIACDPQGHIFVSDRVLCRVTKFGPDMPPVPALPVSWGSLKAGYR